MHHVVAFNQQRTREVQSVWILHQRTKDVIQAGGGKMKDCRDEMSSLIVSLVSGGIHYIGTSLEEHDGRDGSKGNKRPSACTQVNQSGKQNHSHRFKDTCSNCVTVMLKLH